MPCRQRSPGVLVRALIARPRHRPRAICAVSNGTCSRPASSWPDRAATPAIAKMLIADGHTLQVHAFNCTTADLRSRSLGVITTDPRLVQAAIRLFEADLARRLFQRTDDLLVSGQYPGSPRILSARRAAAVDLRLEVERSAHPPAASGPRRNSVDARHRSSRQSVPLRVEKLRHHACGRSSATAKPPSSAARA